MSLSCEHRSLLPESSSSSPHLLRLLLLWLRSKSLHGKIAAASKCAYGARLWLGCSLAEEFSIRLLLLLLAESLSESRFLPKASWFRVN